MSDHGAKIDVEIGGDRHTLHPGGSIKLRNMLISVDASGKVSVTGVPTDHTSVAALSGNAGVPTLSNGP